MNTLSMKGDQDKMDPAIGLTASGATIYRQTNDDGTTRCYVWRAKNTDVNYTHKDGTPVSKNYRRRQRVTVKDPEERAFAPKALKLNDVAKLLPQLSERQLDAVRATVDALLSTT